MFASPTDGVDPARTEVEAAATALRAELRGLHTALVAAAPSATSPLAVGSTGQLEVLGRLDRTLAEADAYLFQAANTLYGKMVQGASECGMSGGRGGGWLHAVASFSPPAVTLHGHVRHARTDWCLRPRASARRRVQSGRAPSLPPPPPPPRPRARRRRHGSALPCALGRGGRVHSATTHRRQRHLLPASRGCPHHGGEGGGGNGATREWRSPRPPPPLGRLHAPPPPPSTLHPRPSHRSLVCRRGGASAPSPFGATPRWTSCAPPSAPPTGARVWRLRS
jgi:hypothetical protein